MSTAQRRKKTASQHHRVSLRIIIQAAQAQHIQCMFSCDIVYQTNFSKIAPFVLSHLWTLPWPSTVLLFSFPVVSSHSVVLYIYIFAFRIYPRALQNGGPLNAVVNSNNNTARRIYKIVLRSNGSSTTTTSSHCIVSILQQCDNIQNALPDTLFIFLLKFVLFCSPFSFHNKKKN